MDSHTRDQPHGRLHGMPLAWLLGLDDDPLYGLGAGVLKPQHVCLVGVRSYEPEEDERLRKLGVRVVFMDEIRSRGIDAVLDEALDIATAGTSGFGVSIDLDVIEPEEAPHVGTPVTGGVTSAELARALETSPAGLASPRSSSSNTARASITRAAPRASRWICSPRCYAGRARMRKSSPRRSIDSRRSLILFSRRTAGRSSMPCAPSPRKLGL